MWELTATTYTFFFPFVVFIVVPQVLRFFDQFLGSVDLGALRLVGIPVFLIAAFIAIWCIALFFTVGGGSPNPLNPPKRFVVAGPYRVVRNPLVLCAFGVVLAQAIFFGSPTILIFLLFLVPLIHQYLAKIEEPALERRFGTDYLTYKSRVPRWLPRLPL